VAMLVVGPVAEKAGIRNLYLASAAILLTIGAVGFAKLRKPEALAAKTKSATAD